jgi:hypothetical protein
MFHYKQILGNISYSEDPLRGPDDKITVLLIFEHSDTRLCVSINGMALCQFFCSVFPCSVNIAEDSTLPPLKVSYRLN